MLMKKSRLFNVIRSNNEKTKFYNKRNIFVAVFELCLPEIESITGYTQEMQTNVSKTAVIEVEATSTESENAISHLSFRHNSFKYDTLRKKGDWCDVCAVGKATYVIACTWRAIIINVDVL